MALRVGASLPQFLQQVTLDPSSIGANTISSETFTVTGVVTDTMYRCDALSLEAGLFIISCIPSATNTLTISIWNSTNSTVNPASQTFRIIGF